MSPRLRLLAVLVCVFVCVVAFVGAARPPHAPAATRSPLIEVLTGSNVNQLVAAHPVLATFFNHRRVYPLGNPAADQVQATGVPKATPSLIYPSYERFAADIAAGRIDPRIQVVVYDPEYWASTPPTEQQDPVGFMKRFSDLAHQHGYRVILTPARDLMLVTTAGCHKAVGEQLDHAYLRCGIPAAAARDAGMVEVQSQVDEFSPTRFRSLLVGATAQARAANPKVVVLAGISTRPPTGTATFLSMVTDARIAAAVTDGLWVNVFPRHPQQLRVGGKLFGWLQQHGY